MTYTTRLTFNEKSRILLASFSFIEEDYLKVHMVYDAPQGAYHHYCSQLCNALITRSDITELRLVAIFGPRDRPDIAPDELDLLDSRISIQIIGFWNRYKFMQYLLFTKNLLKYIWQLLKACPDIVHIQTPTGAEFFDLFLLLMYRILGIPVIRTVHEPTAAERIGYPTAFARFMALLQLRLVSELIVHNSPTCEHLRGWLGKDNINISIIPHGNYLFFRQYINDEAEASRPDRCPDTTIALFFGIKRHKGIEVFVKAIQQLSKENYPIEAVVVGRVNPGDEDLLEVVKRQNVIRLHPGHIPNSELWMVFSKSDFVVMPYIKGTTSGAIHLAYAFKKPVIVSDLEFFRDMVVHGRTGLITPKGDYVALVEAIRKMCEDKELRDRMGEEGFRFISSRQYQWDTIAGQTVQVYQSARRKGFSFGR